MFAQNISSHSLSSVMLQKNFKFAFNSLNSALFKQVFGKSFLINDTIIKHNLDFMFWTATWLEQDKCLTVLSCKTE